MASSAKNSSTHCLKVTQWPNGREHQQQRLPTPTSWVDCLWLYRVFCYTGDRACVAGRGVLLCLCSQDSLSVCVPLKHSSFSLLFFPGPRPRGQTGGGGQGGQGISLLVSGTCFRSCYSSLVPASGRARTCSLHLFQKVAAPACSHFLHLLVWLYQNFLIG